MLHKVMATPTPTPTLTPTPTPQSPPLAVITSNDKVGLIVIVTAIGLAAALVSLLIRSYVRFRFSPKRFGWDDGYILAAFIFSLFQNACVFFAAHKGYGRTIHALSSQDLIEIQKAEYADDILYIISVWLTKVSAALLYLRLSPKRGHQLAAKVDAGFAAVTAVASILVVALRCNLSMPWIHINKTNAQCSGLFARWEAVAAFDIATEVLLCATAIYLLQALRIPLIKKSSIFFAFALRLPLIVPIVLRLHYLGRALNSPDYTLHITYAAICKQVEISYAIIAAVVPCLRPFVMATMTYYGGNAEGPRTNPGTRVTTVKSNKSTSSSRSRRRDEKSGYHLSSLTTPTSPRRQSLSRSHSGQIWGDTSGTHIVSVVAGGGARKKEVPSAGSSESGLITIRNEIESTVDYHSATTDGDHDEIGTVR